MSQKEELKRRVNARRKELEATIERSRAETSKQTRDAAKAAEKELNELTKTLKGGWDNLTEHVAGRLNRWLSKSHDD